MFLGYNKNLNYKNKAIQAEFLKQGEQTQNIFADAFYLSNQIGRPENANDIKKIIKFIKKNIVKKCELKNRKYERTAKEIWISQFAENGCDYCTVFESIARQLQIPTVHLQMVEKNWKEYSRKAGFIEKHDACECFIDGKWIYVDPALDEINSKYNPNNLEVVSNEAFCTYRIFSKSTDAFEAGVRNTEENAKIIKKLFTKQNHLEK